MSVLNDNAGGDPSLLVDAGCVQCWTRNCSCLCQVFVTYFSSDQPTRYLSPTWAFITHLNPQNLLEPRSPGKVFVTYLSQHHPLEPRSPDKVYSPVLTHSSSRCVTSLSHSNSLACHLSVKGGRRICFDGYHFSDTFSWKYFLPKGGRRIWPLSILVSLGCFLYGLRHARSLSQVGFPTSFVEDNFVSKSRRSIINCH